MIARLDSPKRGVMRVVCRLLKRVSREHPQALVYTLSVQVKSPSPLRAKIANKVLNTIRRQNEGLVEAATLVSEELIR